MAQFRFRLEKVLQYKRQRHREAELRLQQAMNKARFLERQLKQLRLRIAEMADRMDRAVRAGQAPPVGWHAQHALSRQAMREADHTSRQLVEQQQQCHRCQQELRQLQIEMESLETLRQHAWEAFQRDLQRSQQRQLDELVLQQHARRRPS